MRILVIRLSAIGDIVLTAAALRCLRLRYGERLELHFLVKKEYKAAAALLREVDLLHEYDKKAPKYGLGDLQKIDFDAVVDLQNSWRTLLLRWRLRSRQTLVLDKLNLRKWLYVQLKMPLMPDRHTALRYTDVFRPLGVAYDGRGLAEGLRVVETADLLPAGTSERIAIAIGAAHATKRIPTDILAAVIERLAASGRGVLLLGAGAADEERAAEIMQQLPVEIVKGAWAVSLVGKLSLAQSVAAVERAAAVLAGDTGLMHIAAALCRPLVLVWGNTSPQLGMSAFYPEELAQKRFVSMEISGLACRPCSKLGKKDCPRLHFDCMRRHSAAEIAANLLGLLVVGSK